MPKISRIKPDLLGFSVCYEVQFLHAMYLGKRIKENYPSMFVVMGGTHVNMLEGDFQKVEIDLFSFADAYVIGEGEIPMNALIEALQQCRELSTVPGLFYRNNQNQIQATEPPVTIPLEELHPPDFSAFPLEKYLSPKNVIPYRVSRGCYWNKCAFCSHFQTREFSFKNARYVVEDVKKLMAHYQTDFIYFVDDALPRAFLEKFADLLISENIDVKWLGNVRPEKFLTEPFIAKMAQAGCKEIYLGIESASQRLLVSINKGIDVNNVERIVNDCHKHSISIKMNFIRGLPSERCEDISQTIRFIKKNAKNCDIICLTPLVVDSDTDLSENPARYGLEIIDKRRSFSTALNFKRTTGILDDNQLKWLYSKDENLFNRFHFFSRIHHFLYSVKFSRKEFEHLTSQYFLITDNLENKQPQKEQECNFELTWKPYIKSHRFIPFSFNINATDGEFINGRLQVQKSYYTFSLHKFNYSHAFNEKGYKLLSLCNGKNTIKNMIAILSSQQYLSEIPWDRHLKEILIHFFNTGLIDFNE